MIRNLRSGNKTFPVDFLPYKDNHLKVRFGWRPGQEWSNLKDEIKAMHGAKFQPKTKTEGAFWIIKDCDRNKWTLDHLDIATPSPYTHYDTPIEPLISPSRDLFDHQTVMFHHAYYKKRVILAAEMGTGKTLVAIELLEAVKPRLAWYIAPKFALHAIRLEFKKWKATKRPMFMSYDEMKRIVKNWDEGRIAPDMVFFDESAYLKTATSLRSQYAQDLADGMRQDHPDPYIILMSGTPAPKSPEDWWKQCEICCPGFLKEGHPASFKRRLALIVQEESFAGGSYPKLITWFDDEHKCKTCGELSDHPIHTMSGLINGHSFVPSTNEVQNLYHRLKGLVLVQFKKDCLDLPDKVYRPVEIPMTASMKRAMNTIIKTSPTTIQALTRCRELSDGFQYEHLVDESKLVTCKRCKGTGIAIEYEPEREIQCPKCEGHGVVGKVIKEAKTAKSPKDEALIELLHENEDYGRIVIYAGFTASIERCVEICKKQNWDVIRIDGVAEENTLGLSTEDVLEAFQDTKKYPQNIAFIGHPATVKTALTLTAASMIVYFSNTFIGDDRIQSEDRIHRIGMDKNRGATIVDLLHLPTDLYVLDNLKNKRRLQGITLGQFQQEMEKVLEAA